MATHQLGVQRSPCDVPAASSHRHGHGKVPSLASRVSVKAPTEGLGFGLSPRSGELLGGREDRIRCRAFREEDWAKLFKPEAMKKDELKEYLNDEPIWLWVFKSWHSGIKGAFQFLWTQPGQIKYIEWPSVKSTVKMALLTLVVVMFLMVFLYSADALFRHILKSSVRRMA